MSKLEILVRIELRQCHTGYTTGLACMIKCLYFMH